MNKIMPQANPRSRAGATLRAIGVLILLLGLGGAGAVYWTGAPQEDLSGDVATARTSKRQARDIEINAGKMGLLMNDLMEDFQDPGTQAVTLAVVSILAASGCFYFARLQSRGEASAGPVI